MLPAAPGWAGTARCAPPGKTYPNPSLSPQSSQSPAALGAGVLKSQTHSGEWHLQGCPHSSQEPGWTTSSGRRPQSGWAVPDSSSRVCLGGGREATGREGGFLSGPWSPGGFAKSIFPLIPGGSLALWSGSRPHDQAGAPRTSDLAWWRGSQLKRPLVGRPGPAPTRALGEPRAPGWAGGETRGPAVPSFLGGQSEFLRAGPGEVIRALFPGAG